MSSEACGSPEKQWGKAAASPSLQQHWAALSGPVPSLPGATRESIQLQNANQALPLLSLLTVFYACCPPKGCMWCVTPLWLAPSCTGAFWSSCRPVLRGSSCISPKDRGFLKPSPKGAQTPQGDDSWAQLAGSALGPMLCLAPIPGATTSTQDCLNPTALSWQQPAC